MLTGLDERDPEHVLFHNARRLGHVPQASVRPYRASDLDDLYRICLQTGDNGKDGTPIFEDPRILGHVVAAPYGVFEPSLAFVAEDELGVGGYIVGALDSKAFARRLETDWWPALREQGSVGVHFFVSPTNHRAIGFYRHLGFTVISAEGPVIFAMNLRPAASATPRIGPGQDDH